MLGGASSTACGPELCACGSPALCAVGGEGKSRVRACAGCSTRGTSTADCGSGGVSSSTSAAESSAPAVTAEACRPGDAEKWPSRAAAGASVCAADAAGSAGLDAGNVRARRSGANSSGDGDAEPPGSSPAESADPGPVGGCSGKTKRGAAVSDERARPAAADCVAEEEEAVDDSTRLSEPSAAPSPLRTRAMGADRTRWKDPAKAEAEASRAVLRGEDDAPEPLGGPAAATAAGEGPSPSPSAPSVLFSASRCCPSILYAKKSRRASRWYAGRCACGERRCMAVRKCTASRTSTAACGCSSAG